MIPILACSLISLTIVLERLCVLLGAKRSGHRLWAGIENLLQAGRWEEALALCQRKRNAGPVGRLIAGSIVSRDMGPEKREKELLTMGANEIKGLEKHLWFLSLIADIAPLLGLLGTVTGMVKAFIKIQEFGGRVDASLLAGGIWEALITTVAGLSVAIPTMVAYHYLERKVSEFSDLPREVLARVEGIIERKD